MEFKELTDERWSFVKPLLPPQPHVGRKRADDRKVVNGILYLSITAWQMARYSMVHIRPPWRRHETWSEEGIWDRVLKAIRERAYANGILTLNSVAIDSTLIESKKGANPQGTMDTIGGKG
ncbi:MAG: transposase [Methanothrix sp.]|nr:transposase [Methanothrix sp.]